MWLAQLYPRRACRKQRLTLRGNLLGRAGKREAVQQRVGNLSAPLLATFEPLEQDVAARLQRPGYTKTIVVNDTETQVRHWLGTDELGRDIYSRVIYGGRITIPAGLGPDLRNAIIALVIVWWPTYAWAGAGTEKSGVCRGGAGRRRASHLH